MKYPLCRVLDSFSAHHTIRFRQYAASNNIPLVHHPPSAPDLNPIGSGERSGGSDVHPRLQTPHCSDCTTIQETCSEENELREVGGSLSESEE